MINKVFFDIVKELRREGKTWHEVRQFLVKSKAVATNATDLDVQKRFQEIAAKVAAGEIDLDSSSDFELAVAKIDEFIGRVRDQGASGNGRPTLQPDRKILVISDLHIPYVDHEKMWKAVDAGVEAGCNILVINGDYLNGERLSTHAKFKHESFKEEVAMGTAVLEKLREKFEIVYLLDDNHVGDRWRRWIGNMISPDLHFLLTHPYDYMCAGMDNVVRSNETHSQFPDELGHFMILGDVMFSHAFVSGKDGESVRKIQSWYRNWKHTLGLPDVKITIHGHTHSLGIAHDSNGAAIQIGTLANLEGLRYSLEGNLKYSPPIAGYVILEQFDGKTNLETIQVKKL